MNETIVHAGCRVCGTASGLFYQNERRFFRCPECRLIFTVDAVDKSLEEAHYKKQWAETDPGFWKSQVDVLLKIIALYRTPERLLDFGSGSGEMTKELERRGVSATPLEPMIHGYLKDQRFSCTFDVVVAVEVIEHLPNLWEELNAIENVLATGGIVIFSTLLTNSFVDAPDAARQFADWWYKDDPTHVSFFCNRTLGKLADMGKFDIDVYGDKVFVLKRLPDTVDAFCSPSPAGMI